MVLRLLDFWSNWNLELLVFEGGRKPEYPAENPLGAKERTNKLRGQDEANPTFWLATRARSRPSRSLSPFTLTLALHAHSRASRLLSRSPLRARRCFRKERKEKKTKSLYRLAKDPILLWIDQGKVLFLGLFWLSNKSFINQDCSVKLAGYWTCYFFSFLWIVEPRYNEGSRDWQNLFAIKRFRYMELLFHMFYCTVEKKIVRCTKDFVI